MAGGGGGAGSGIHAGYAAGPVFRAWQQPFVDVRPEDLVMPVFVTDADPRACQAVESLPGVNRYGVDALIDALHPLVDIGLRSVIVFGVVSSSQHKDAFASAATDPKGPAAVAIRQLKRAFPDLVVIADVCMCPYADHGHCGVIDADGRVDVESSVARLAQIALFYAQCGADVVAPSDMMDGRVHAIKDALRRDGFGSRVPVLSYSAKFASCFYGPFRDAAKSAPSKGDRSGYQLPPGSTGLALRAVARDIAEGADFVMVKPAGPYLDVISAVRQRCEVPVFAYQVSGEYAMLRHAASAGAVDLRQAALESLIALKRAGATVIITYFTPDILSWLRDARAA
ncbi:Delta-aminolevulinic acid dehydratase [Plasmodiophora brassicae]